MSTSRTPWASARDQLHEQRRRDALRRYYLHITAKCVAVGVALAVAIGLTIILQTRAAASGPVVAPAGASGDDGLVIPVGRPQAPVVLTVYEDVRCPGCAQLERALRATVNRLEDEGRVRVDYHLLSFVDRIVGGKGSKVAANALAAAQEAGRFREFHDVLFAHHPAEESMDVFADREFLLRLADQVPGLRSAEFDKAVADGTHSGWVQAVQRRFDEQSVLQGTPAVVLDGENLVSDQDHLLTPERLLQLVDQAAAGKEAPGTPTSP
ncbi:DsbA family protein [Streptomyces sp. NPDC002535]